MLLEFHDDLLVCLSVSRANTVAGYNLPPKEFINLAYFWGLVRVPSLAQRRDYSRPVANGN